MEIEMEHIILLRLRTSIKAKLSVDPTLLLLPADLGCPIKHSASTKMNVVILLFIRKVDDIPSIV